MVEDKRAWVASADEENWNACEVYDSQEDAIRDGPVDQDFEPGTRFWVGYKVRVRAPRLLDWMILNHIEQLYGEQFAELDRYDGLELSDEEGRGLLATVNDAIEEWFKTHGTQCFCVEGVTEHVVPEKEAQG